MIKDIDLIVDLLVKATIDDIQKKLEAANGKSEKDYRDIEIVILSCGEAK